MIGHRGLTENSRKFKIGLFGLIPQVSLEKMSRLSFLSCQISFMSRIVVSRAVDVKGPLNHRGLTENSRKFKIGLFELIPQVSLEKMSRLSFLSCQISFMSRIVVSRAVDVKGHF